LTAGLDTRIILACARDRLERIKFLTMYKYKVEIDFQLATRIANQFKLNHESLRYKPPTLVEQKMFLELSSQSVGGPVTKYFTTLHQSDPKRPILTGLGGGFYKGHYWKNYNANLTTLNVNDIVELLGLPKLKFIDNYAEQWLHGLSDYDPLIILELLHCEMRMGCWGAPQQYGNYWNIFELIPFVHRRIQELALSLPYDYRREKKLAIDLIKNQWSELLNIPFNQYGGNKGFILLLIQKIRNRNRRIVHYLRGYR
jgi:hypothetical protein